MAHRLSSHGHDLRPGGGEVCVPARRDFLRQLVCLFGNARAARAIRVSILADCARAKGRR